MTPGERLELDELRSTQRLLRKDLDSLEHRIERLIRSATPDAPEPLPVSLKLAPSEPEPAHFPPPLPDTAPTASLKMGIPAPMPGLSTPKPDAPAPFPDAPAQNRDLSAQPSAARAPMPGLSLPKPETAAPIPVADAPTRDLSPPKSAAAAPSPVAPAAGSDDSLEFKLGAYWFVRVGVVMLLTGLVFLGNYAYHHLIAQLGPLAKVLMLYLAGAGLAAAGVWIERGEEKMRNFARVLIAGGAAAIYYTTYAAHFVPRLRVIESPIVGGGLLLLLAGGIAWFADRRKSESVALLAVMLSYYTATINPAAGFSLFSNLLLAVLAIVLLARHRWAALSFVSLAATYASFAYWRFFHLGQMFVPSGLTTSEFWSQGSFLFCYWAVFSVAVFVSRGEALTARQRTPFLTANNAAFFGLLAPTVGVAYPGSFATFALGFGAVLLCLSLLARKVRGEDAAMEGSYLAQGLAVVTVGIAAKFTGYQLALALAVESAVLLEMARFRFGGLYQIGAGLTAAGAFAFALKAFAHDRAQVVPLGSALAFIFLFDAWRFKQVRGELAEPRFRWRPAGYVTFGLLMGLAVVFESAGTKNFAPMLALVALGCALSLPLLRLPELALLGQAHMAIAGAMWIFAIDHTVQPWWHAPVLAGSALAALHWWPRQKVFALPAAVEMPYAAMVTAVLFTWIEPRYSGAPWMMLSGAVAVGMLAYGCATRAWWLAGFSQAFTAASVLAWMDALATAPGAWPLPMAWPPLVMIALFAVQTAAATMLAKRLPKDTGEAVALVAQIYRVALSAMVFVWVLADVPRVAQFDVLIALVAVLIAVGLRGSRVALMHAAGIGTGALVCVWFRQLSVGEVYAADTAGVLLLLAAQQVARRAKAEPALFPEEGHQAMIVAGVVTGWAQATHFAAHNEHGILITITWTVLALAVLGAGFLLSERLHRQCAVGLFGCAVGRVLLVDVWKFETIYRMLTFVVLGVVLIVAGYLYNRYGERFRKLL